MSTVKFLFYRNQPDVKIEDCHSNSPLGCVILSTKVALGEVSCVGDGVDRTVRYPIRSLGNLIAYNPIFNTVDSSMEQLTVIQK
jgi:hypothetical protein